MSPQNALAYMSRTLLYLSVFSNIVLGGVIFLRLNVTPADVILEVRSQTIATQARVEAIELTLTTLAEKDQCFERWCAKAKELNPSLNVPDLTKE